MITYNKLFDLMKKKNLTWTDLKNGTSQSPTIIAKLQRNENCNVSTVNKVCEYLKVQPGDIMEWIPDAEYEEKKQNADKLALEKQIAELQARLKELNK